MRIRFVGTCSKCKRRHKIVTDVDFSAPYVRSAFCHGCKTIFAGFRLSFDIAVAVLSTLAVIP